MRKLIHKTRDKNYSRRLTALLMNNEEIYGDLCLKKHNIQHVIPLIVGLSGLHYMDSKDSKVYRLADLLSGIFPLSITCCFVYYSNLPKSSAIFALAGALSS